MITERHLRINEVSAITGYAVPTLRKKLGAGEIAYRKLGRIVSIPESEVERLLGVLHRPPQKRIAREPTAVKA